MSRAEYSDDCDDILAYGRWLGVIKSAKRGKRGQAFFKDLVVALDALPVKRLIREDLCKNGEVCTLGALGVKRGIKMDGIDPEDSEKVAETFGISDALARETVYQNDEYFDSVTPEERWQKMRDWAAANIIQAQAQTFYACTRRDE